jgi:hypothetical protein
MTLEVAAIVKDARHFDDACFAVAIEKEVPGIFDAGAAYTASAEPKMVRPGTLDHQVGPSLTTQDARDRP